MSNSMYAWKYIIVLDIKEKKPTLFYYIHIVNIPNNKRANSYKLKLLTIGNNTYGGRSQI